MGHRLDAFSSGVLGVNVVYFVPVIVLLLLVASHNSHCLSFSSVLAVGNGNKLLNDLYRTQVTRVILDFHHFHVRNNSTMKWRHSVNRFDSV